MDVRKLTGVGIGMSAAVLLAALTWHTTGGKAVVQRVLEPMVPAAWLNPARISQRTAAASPLPAARVTHQEWKARFDAANDYRAFIQSALPAAQAHDPRAEYLIAQALVNCRGVFMDYQGVADPEVKLQQELTRMAGPEYYRTKGLPQWDLDAREHKVRQCLPLLKDGIPGGHDEDYWWQRALTDGEPLTRAEEIQAATTDISVPNNNLTPEEKAQKMLTVQKDLLAVLQSGDPDALFVAARAMGYPGTNTLHSAAVVLAACQMGADCSEPGCGIPNIGPAVDANGNPVHSCPAGADFPYMMQMGLGQETYAALDAQAQQIKQMQAQGNYQGVVQYLIAAK